MRSKCLDVVLLMVSCLIIHVGERPVVLSFCQPTLMTMAIGFPPLNASMSAGMAVNIEGKCSRTQTVTVIKDPGEHALMQLRSLRNEQAHHINGMIAYQAISYFDP